LFPCVHYSRWPANRDARGVDVEVGQRSGLPREDDGLPARFETGAALREAAEVTPHEHVADDPPRVLQGDRHAVDGPGAAERQQVRPGLGDTEGGGRPLLVPLLHRLCLPTPHVGEVRPLTPASGEPASAVVATQRPSAGLAVRVGAARVGRGSDAHSPVRQAGRSERRATRWGSELVPLLAHELKPIRRVSAYRVDGIRFHRVHGGDAVRVDDGHGLPRRRRAVSR
jgi:hypothetical protein